MPVDAGLYERRITGEDCGNRLYLVLESQPSGLWNKGASSGHVQKVVSIDYDCGDSLLVKVEQKVQLHTGIIPVSVIHYGTACRQKSAVPETGWYSRYLAELYRVIQDKRVMAAKNLIPVTVYVRTG